MDTDTILVITSEPMNRGETLKEMKLNELSTNINLFIMQMDNLLAKTPEKVGKFQIEEIEVYAEISAKGMLTLLGTGGEVGTLGGLKFIFRRV